MNRCLQLLLSIIVIMIGGVSIFYLLRTGGSVAARCAKMNTGTIPSVETFSSIDRQIQELTQKSITDTVRQTRSTKGLVVVQHIESGHIVAIASKEGVNNSKCFGGWTEAFKGWEPGSVMKTLTASAAINEHRLSLSDQFYNPGELKFGDVTLLNAFNIPHSNYSYQDMVSQSINIGAVNALKRLSNKGKIDKQARTIWYNYLTKRYIFGQPTGAYKYEQSGYVPTPDGQFGTEARYAYMSFGIGLTITPVQLTSAYAAVVNRGRYVPPSLSSDKTKKTLGRQVVSEDTSALAVQMLVTASKAGNQPALRPGYIIGGKSGTAPSSDLTGTYQYYSSVGTYIGFIGKSKPEYIVLVKLDEPKVKDKLAGALAAMAWARTTQQIIDCVYED